VGYSSAYTVGVWVGNFSGEAMWNVSGISGAAPVWIDVMNWLHRDKPSPPKGPPRGVIGQRTEFADFGQSRDEWFIQGTETGQVRAPLSQERCRIVYPVAETIFALDPDIPGSQQQLFFECQPRSGQLHWVLDGEIFGSAGSACRWSPIPGKHILSLVDDRNRTLDSVNFEVRGVAEKGK
jgi:penicillin-binding protein 1C